MYKPISVILFLFILVRANFGQNLPEVIDVNIYNGEIINVVSFTPTAGKYQLFDENNQLVLEVGYHNVLVFKTINTGIEVFRNDTLMASRESFRLRGASFTNSFMINPFLSNLKFRIYDGGLTLKRVAGRFLLINTVPVESYVAGTVQSESGFNRHNVFYQVQAIIIRTYALRNLSRHQSEGYHLCDKVHCQAYYGKTINDSIAFAVEQTRGEVVVDHNSELLNTVYHANCGGETVNSEDLWVAALPYLRSDIDTFCLEMPGAIWEKSLSARDLRNFLSGNPGPVHTTELWEQLTKLDTEKRVHYLGENKQVPLSRVRQQFGLRSTFFNVSQSGDTLYLSGKGYGHGVGLCQEGAMERARHGHSREKILGFYYKGAAIKLLEPVVVFE
jgi:stage II sporulation protein D